MGVQKKASERKKATSCESCTFYAWDDEYEYYVCEADLDEDEMSSFLSGTDFSCPYYQPGDELPDRTKTDVRRDKGEADS